MVKMFLIGGITIHKIMEKYTKYTFDNKLIKSDDMTHQHVSNSYWFEKIHHNKTDKDLKNYLDHIKEKFNGEILPYKPLKRFSSEIELLFTNKQLQHVKNNKYNIMFESVVVGYVDLDEKDED